MYRRALAVVAALVTLLVGHMSQARSADLIVTSGSTMRDYVPIVPTRILDTRIGYGGPGPLGADQALTLQVSGTSSMPTTGVGAVVLNLTATEPTANSHMTVFPNGESRPTASNLNFVAGKTVPNLVIAKLSAAGRIDIYNNAGSVHVIADVMGWFPIGSSYQPQTPVRILDTRAGLGAPLAPVGPNADIDIQISGNGGVPSTGVSAVVLNVTATAPTAASFVAVFPSQSGLPTTSSLNFGAGQTIANAVIMGIGPDGRVRLHNDSGNVELIADVQGWFSSSSTYHSVTPNRVLDSRSALGISTTTPVPQNGVVNVKVTGTSGVPPTGVGAVVLNVTVTEATAPSWVAAYATGSNLPGVSNLNFVAGDTVPNLVIARVGVDGSVAFFNSSGSTHVVVDVAGWFPAPPNGVVSTDTNTSCFVRAGTVLCAGNDQTIGSPIEGSLFATGRGPTPIPGIQNAVSVSTGRNRSCAVLTDATVKCWGYLGTLQSSPVAIPIGQVVQTATGEAATCALKSDGTVWCWGVDSGGAFGTGSPMAFGPWVSIPVQVPGLTGVTILSGNAFQFCAANAAGVNCWGGYSYPATGTPAIKPLTLEAPVGRVTSVAVGNDFACASLPSGRVNCWGASGNLGDGINHGFTNTPPVLVSGISNAVFVAGNRNEACAVRADGRVACWGQGWNGSLGAVGNGGNAVASGTPVTVPGVTDAIALSVGQSHVCAVLGDWSVQCWGSNALGQIGNGKVGSTAFPKPITGLQGATQFSLGSSSCAVVSQTTACWGEVIGGLLGPEPRGSSEPKPNVLSGLSKVSTGLQHGTTCGIVAAGAVSCVGSNAFGILGDGGQADSTTPVTPVGLTSGVTDISLGYHGCAIRIGQLWCWGSNTFGESGPTTSRTPLQVPGVASAVAVKASQGNTCVLKGDGTVFCLGSNYSFLLGADGSGLTSSNMPIQIAGISGATTLSVRDTKGCVTTTIGAVQCWGGGYTFSQTAGTVVTIPGISNAIKVAVGTSHVCALLRDGTVTCFGMGFGARSVTPVGGLGGIVDIESGNYSMCARTSVGDVYCWGSNEGGTLGDGTGFYYSPQKVVF